MKLCPNILFRAFWFHVFCLLLLVPAASGTVAALNDVPGNDATEHIAEYTMDEMVVTASKTEEAIGTIPKHVTVITGEDIRESAGKNIIDLLGRESGIHVRSHSGTDKHSVVDLRGMGDTAGSNVIVMVDGQSVNAPDMSGPSLSTVPLDRIERIEIVRGAGSVVYGSGAVGGVVNIITRKPGEEPAGGVNFSYGSYNTAEARGSFEAMIGDLGLNLDAGFHDSDGYRDNGFYEKRDFDIKAGYTLTDTVSFLLSGTFHEDEYGLPGPVGRADIHSRSRRTSTRYPDDSGETTEMRGTAGIELDSPEWGTLALTRGYNRRYNDYVMGYTEAVSRSRQQTETEEDTRNAGLNYLKDYRLLERFHTVQIGLDHSETEYVRENDYTGVRKNAATEDFGVFINNHISLTDKLLINAGTRYHTYRGRFRTDEKKFFADNVKRWVNGESTRKNWNNNAWALGATYSIFTDVSLFAGYSTSFRIPNVDEFAESAEGLRPQDGKHLEMGGRYRFGPGAAIGLTFFDIRIEDEIYYSDINRNYDDTTIRQGVEADIRVDPVYYLSLRGNYTYTDARFDGEGTTVPLVPAHKVSGVVEWLPTEDFRMSLSGTYTGSVYDGNDTDNDTYAKIDDHAVFDLKATYTRNALTVFAGVNNILDNLYATSAYSEQYYPMPERNVFGGFRWIFK